MCFFNKGFKEIFSTQIVSVLGGLIAGTILAVYTDKILLIPGMMILLPGLLELRNSMGGSFASRLSAGLFLGFIKPTIKKTHLIKGNIYASVILAFIISLFLGLFAFLFNYFFLHIITPKIILIPLIAGTIANAVEVPITLGATFYLFRKGHDPNNIMGPFITSAGDIISIISIIIALVII